ncbi:MAG: Crp/Fnr family transcriptional regulator [Halanaerobiaceae bacterium]
MKTVMVVPTYWGRDTETGWQLGDEIYDHPTPIDREGTLARFIDSMDVLNNTDFELIILVAVTTPELREEAYEKVCSIVSECDPPVPTYIFGDYHLDKIRDYFQHHSELDTGLLKLKGYSNIRNMCLYSAHLLAAEVVVLIDDDEVIEDPDFMDKPHEFIGGRLYGQTVDGIAGYYLNKNREYYDDVEIEPWMTFWNRFGSKRNAFDKIIGCEPRIKKTPFAFGGLMVIHRNLYKVVPFDPELTRGEDIDYVINSRMFGFNFYLDNRLSILHLPPGKKHPVWQRFRQDIYRFFYEREKIRTQREISNMIKIDPEDFDPYPGEFLKDDLEDKVFKTNIILALDYLSNNQIEDARATIKNIYLTKYDAIPVENVFDKYLQVQKSWELLLDFTGENINNLSSIAEEGRLKEKVMVSTSTEEYKDIKELPFFRGLNDADAGDLASICEIREYRAREKILEKGDIDDTIFIIKKGKTKIINRKTEDHEEILLTELEAGDFFGLTSLISSQSSHYLVDVVAQKETIIVAIDRKNLMKYFSNHHQSGVKLLLYFIKKLNEQLEELTDLYTDMHTKTHDILSGLD